MLVAGIVLALVVAVVAGMRLGSSDSTESTQSDDDGIVAGTQDTATSSTAPTSTSTTTTTTPPTTVDPETRAPDTLNDRLASGRSRADATLVARWVPQLSSKQIEITDRESGITYGTYQSILDDFNQSASLYGDVLLLDSGAFSTFTRAGLYVTVAAVPYLTPAEANGWCNARAIPPKKGFAKLIGHSAPPSPDAQAYRG